MHRTLQREFVPQLKFNSIARRYYCNAAAKWWIHTSAISLYNYRYMRASVIPLYIVAIQRGIVTESEIIHGYYSHIFCTTVVVFFLAYSYLKKKKKNKVQRMYPVPNRVCTRYLFVTSSAIYLRACCRRAYNYIKIVRWLSEPPLIIGVHWAHEIRKLGCRACERELIYRHRGSIRLACVHTRTFVRALRPDCCEINQLVRSTLMEYSSVDGAVALFTVVPYNIIIKSNGL